MKKYLIALIKITNHPEDLIRGNLYCNRLKYFMETEKKEIGDIKESTAVVLRFTDILNRYYRLNIQDEDLQYNPAFCLYAVLGDKYCNTSKLRLYDSKLKSFGRYVVVINDIKEFFFRIQEQQPKFSYSIVRYIDFSNPSGEDKRSIFNPIVKKDLYFEYQNEFRIYSHYIALTNKESEKFGIGNLNDITEIYKTEELFIGRTVDLKVDWNYCSTNNFDRSSLNNFSKIGELPN